MFGIIADLLASITTILFPVFASYKALRTSDPAQLAPWLIYWVILSLILLVESWTVFILGWLPFYSWFRFFALSYLVLPQTQGAKLLYTNHLEPFIANHEHQIEAFIGDLHEKGTGAGLGYLKDLIDLIRERFLGLPPTRGDRSAQANPPTSGIGYAQSLLSRFAMPSARAPTPSDFYSILSGAVAAATASSSSSTTRSQSDTTPTSLFPYNITSPTDKQSFLNSQREKLSVLTKALDREQRDLDLAYGSGGRDGPPTTRTSGVKGLDEEAGDGSGGLAMRKNRSDNSFQNIEREEMEEDEDEEIDGGGRARAAGKQHKRPSAAAAGRRTTSGGSWNPTTWFTGGGAGDGEEEEISGPGRERSMGEIAQGVRDAVQGLSSGVDTGR